MTLDILVSHYDEPLDMVGEFLRMVDCQDADMSGVRVIIGNDGGVPVPPDMLSGYRFDARCVESIHAGISHIRNVLLDSSDAEYVMLCDVDDCFHDDACLSRYLDLCDGTDMVVTGFVLRLPDRDELLSPRTTLVHGKLFRRAYLTENDIRFDDDLVRSSDEYFVIQALALTRSVSEVFDPLYVWMYRDDSVCHGTSDFIIRTHWLHVEADGRLAERYMGDAHLSGVFSAKLVHRSYVTMHTDAWRRHSDEFDCRFAVRCLSWWLARLYGRYMALPENARRYRYNMEHRMFGDDQDPPFEGIGVWVDEVMRAGETWLEGVS